MFFSGIQGRVPNAAITIELLASVVFQLGIGTYFISKKRQVVKRLQASASRSLRTRLSIKMLSYSAIFMFMQASLAFFVALPVFGIGGSILAFYGLSFSGLSIGMTDYCQIRAIPLPKLEDREGSEALEH